MCKAFQIRPEIHNFKSLLQTHYSNLYCIYIYNRVLDISWQNFSLNQSINIRTILYDYIFFKKKKGGGGGAKEKDRTSLEFKALSLSKNTETYTSSFWVICGDSKMTPKDGANAPHSLCKNCPACYKTCFWHDPRNSRLMMSSSI